MFRPRCILQVAAVLLLVSGCSSTHPESSAHPLPTSPDSGVDQSSPRTAPPQTAPASPGARPAPLRGDFVDAADRLLPEVDAFAQEVARTRNIPLQNVRALLSAAQYNDTAVRLMRPTARRIQRSWVTYRQRNVDPIRIRSGLDFWRTHQRELAHASQTYGVPPSIIVAIIGIETVYGRHMGTFSVLDTLTTLGFRYPDPSRPERQRMFREQLADLIQLHQQGKLDAYAVKGSFAGAIGLPQFMPGSLANFAADGDGDGRIDVQRSTADAIASVARFLRLHGWVPGLPVFAPVVLPAGAGALVQGGLAPDKNWTVLQNAGARLASHGRSGAPWQAHPLGVIDLPDEPRQLHEYRSATPNFFAITHYNRSYFYAAAVADLAEELARRMGDEGSNRVGGQPKTPVDR